jgi:hypothetical protein
LGNGRECGKINKLIFKRDDIAKGSKLGGCGGIVDRGETEFGWRSLLLDQSHSAFAQLTLAPAFGQHLPSSKPVVRRQ